MQMSNDEWYALLDKIDMIPDKELAHNMLECFMLTEYSRWNKSDKQRYLRNFIDFILAKKQQH